ncbi:hypothetical protein BHM03_00061771 [Ensete ventricosum]|nr:hypothetical protein BHM03_00061771 [Ensete ventricosum]
MTRQYNQVLGRSQVPTSSWGPDDAVETRLEIAKSLPKVSGASWKLAKAIGVLPGVRRELARNTSGVRQKMTETRREFARGYREDCLELGRSLDTLVKLIVFVCHSI